MEQSKNVVLFKKKPKTDQFNMRISADMKEKIRTLQTRFGVDVINHMRNILENETDRLIDQLESSG